jgi:FkbH-like protein
LIEFWARRLGLPAEIRFAPYNQVSQTLLDAGGEFGSNAHGVNVVLCRIEDLAQFEGSDEAALARLEQNARQLAALLTDAAARLRVPLLFALCPPSPRFAAEAHRAGAVFSNLKGVHLIDASELIPAEPAESWYDAEADRLAHIPYTELWFAALSTAIVRRARALSAPPAKVIAVDCDNTLWRGICGEDGAAGVALEEPHRHLQQFLLAQRAAGALLVLASKNNEQDVFDTFAAHPEFPLELTHFSAWRLNWTSKAANLAELAAELNVGLDSFIFIDDNPKEIAEVAGSAPEVLALALPENTADFEPFLRHVWAFDRPAVTDEDRQRAGRIGQSVEFARQARRAASLEEFIAGLNLRVDFQPLAPERLDRVAQLTQRTNQFNTTTIRRTEAELQALLARPGYSCFTAEVSDRFGDYGLVGVALLQTRVDEVSVDTLLLSCRALGRGVEHRLLASIAEQALDQGIYTVSVPFHPTAKNMPTRQFLASIAGGVAIEENGGLIYRFSATALQALRWKPSSGPAPVTEAAAARPSALPPVDYASIATQLRTPAQVLAAARREARQALAAPAAAEAPLSELERRLAVIWEELLRQSVVSGSASFFDLGGHSLLAVLLLMRIKEEFGVELTVDDVYSGALTLAGLASVIEARQLGALDPEEYQALLAEIEHLSDDEVRALLELEQPDE